jgi:dipeptidyl aminopeptidase/acylaminoacyl peptidase
VLYVPEDFDAAKKWPLIIHYYERKSDDLNKFPDNDLTMSDHLPIAWFVSHGYVVFTPDIRYRIGSAGESALNAVTSAARYLVAHFAWVDPRRIGIQGHSWGGYETNYIVAHTSMFAAAMSSSGVSDLVSDYVSLVHADESDHYFCETDQCGIGPTLWQRPDLYIEGSPIFHADRVSTPMLMMANRGDAAVPFSQGVEWFLGLRRLGKKVWMLSYDGAVHSLYDKEQKKDLTTRVTQFFDHYLKGAPAPKWMTEGVPANRKGIETGLELDTSGAVP